MPARDNSPMPATRQRIEPRVSDETFDKMCLLAGSTLEGMRETTIYMTIDGQPYKVEFDKDGGATVERSQVPAR